MKQKANFTIVSASLVVVNALTNEHVLEKIF